MPKWSADHGQYPYHPVASGAVSPTVPAGSPMLRSSIHRQQHVSLLCFDQDGGRGVLSGCFGTISMMHFDSLGQAYALNPHEKGSPEWRGSPQQPSKDSGQVRVWKERPGSVSHAPHADSMWLERGDSCPVLQSKQGQWSRVTV